MDDGAKIKVCKRPKHPASLPSPPLPSHPPNSLRPWGASGFPADCHFCCCKLGHRRPSIARLHPRRPLGYTRLGRLILPLLPAFAPDPDPEGRREKKKINNRGEWLRSGGVNEVFDKRVRGGRDGGDGGGGKVCVCCKRSGQEEKTHTDQKALWVQVSGLSGIKFMTIDRSSACVCVCVSR